MRLVIDIPENEYRHIKEYYEKNDIVESAYSYIYHGTPLEQELIILEENKEQLEKLKELIHDNPLCAAMAGSKADTWSIEEVADALERHGLLEREPKTDVPDINIGKSDIEFSLRVLTLMKDYYNDWRNANLAGFDEGDNRAIDIAIKALQQISKYKKKARRYKLKWLRAKWELERKEGKDDNSTLDNSDM